jgi:chromosome condensin MukBEF MukE localization factor
VRDPPCAASNRLRICFEFPAEQRSSPVLRFGAHSREGEDPKEACSVRSTHGHGQAEHIGAHILQKALPQRALQQPKDARRSAARALNSQLCVSC